MNQVQFQVGSLKNRSEQQNGQNETHQAKICVGGSLQTIIKTRNAAQVLKLKTKLHYSWLRSISYWLLTCSVC